MLLDFFLIVVFSLLLIKATDWIVFSIRYFSKTTGLGKYSLTSLVLALATSLPEFSVAMAAALENNPSLVLGNVIGSNIVNLSLVVGGGAVVGGTIAAHGQFLRHDVFYAFLAGALPMLLLIDGQLGLGDGLVLLVVYLVYNATVLREERQELAEKSVRRRRVGLGHRVLVRLKDSKTERYIGWFILGGAGLIISADGIVRAAVGLSASLGVPVLLVGLFLVALGTSLPELAFEIRALRLKEAKMVLGNLMGSVVANATLILGLMAILRPVSVTNGLQQYLTATIAYVVMFAVFYWFVRTKRKLERWEGAVLVGLYGVFLVIEMASRML